MAAGCSRVVGERGGALRAGRLALGRERGKRNYAMKTTRRWVYFINWTDARLRDQLRARRKSASASLRGARGRGSRSRRESAGDSNNSAIPDCYCMTSCYRNHSTTTISVMLLHRYYHQYGYHPGSGPRPPTGMVECAQVKFDHHHQEHTAIFANMVSADMVSTPPKAAHGHGGVHAGEVRPQHSGRAQLPGDALPRGRGGFRLRAGHLSGVDKGGFVKGGG